MVDSSSAQDIAKYNTKSSTNKEPSASFYEKKLCVSFKCVLCINLQRNSFEILLSPIFLVRLIILIVIVLPVPPYSYAT